MSSQCFNPAKSTVYECFKVTFDASSILLSRMYPLMNAVMYIVYLIKIIFLLQRKWTSVALNSMIDGKK